PEVKLDSLDELLKAVWEARKQGLEVVSCDDPKVRALGYVLGDLNYSYVTLTTLKTTRDVSPEVSSLYGLAPEDFRKMSQPEFRYWVATGQEVEFDASGQPIEKETDLFPLEGEGSLSAIWIEEAVKDKPLQCRIEMPEGFRGPINFVPDDGTAHPEIPRPVKEAC
ncbi:MAG: hypothetical protein WC824_07990, partial [Bacteroidota bacterium]